MEKIIQDAIIANILTYDFIKTNAIPVVPFRSVVEEIKKIQCVVNVFPHKVAARGPSGQIIAAKCRVEISAAAHNKNDSAKTIDDLCSFISSYVNGFTRSKLSISGVSIQGILSEDSSGDYMERYESKTSSFTIFFTPITSIS